MLGDTANDFRRDVAAQLRGISDQQQQTAIILTKLDSRLTVLEEASKEQKQDAKAAPAMTQTWLYLLFSGIALIISVLSFMSSHVSLH